MVFTKAKIFHLENLQGYINLPMNFNSYVSKLSALLITQIFLFFKFEILCLSFEHTHTFLCKLPMVSATASSATKVFVYQNMLLIYK